MQWIAVNWLLLLLGGGMVAMHLFGHSHGKKGGQNHTSDHATKRDRLASPKNKQPSKGHTDA